MKTATANVTALKLDMDLKTLHHELRTPLTGILGAAELLNDEGLSVAERQEFTACLVEAGNRLKDFIEALLASPVKEISLDKYDLLRFKKATEVRETLALLVDNELSVAIKPSCKI